MMTVRRQDTGFRVGVSEPGLGRFAVRVTTAEQAALCVIHYFGDRSSSKHGLGQVPGCPFCQSVARKRRRLV